MFLRGLIARALLMKGSAIGCVGGAYWLFGQTDVAAVLVALALCYVVAGWCVDRGSR